MSLMFTAPAWYRVNPSPLCLYEIEFQSSLLFQTRKRCNEFHLLRLRGAQTATVTAAVFIKITGNPLTHTRCSLLLSTCQLCLVTPTFGVNFQAINLGNITSKGNCPDICGSSFKRSPLKPLLTSPHCINHCLKRRSDTWQQHALPAFISTNVCGEHGKTQENRGGKNKTKLFQFLTFQNSYCWFFKSKWRKNQKHCFN